MFDYNKINEICSNIDILNYIKKNNTLNRSGDYYYCKCSNNSDTTPSLCIYPKTNSFFCYSCNKGGNLYNYLVSHEHLKPKEAFEKICEIANVETDYYEISQTKEALKKIIKPNIKKDLNRETFDFQKEYLDKYSAEPIVEWQKEGISQKIMDKFYIRIDHQTNRIIYPLFDNNNNYIGWKGRSLLGDEMIKSFGIPKYLPNKKIGKINFLVKMRDLDLCGKVLLFEGIKSVMHVTQWGYMAASTETAHINDEQVKELLKCNNIDEIIFAYDKDKDFKYVSTQKQISILKRFFKVSAIIDTNGLLDEKMSPCDKGKDIFKKLYDERKKIK